MPDRFTIVREFLLAQPALTALIGDRIEVGGPLSGTDGTISAQFDINDGPAIVYNTRGGTRDETDLIILQSFQFLCYAIDTVTAMRVADTLYSVLRGKKSRYILYADQDTEPQLSQESAADWPFAFSFWTIRIKER